MDTFRILSRSTNLSKPSKQHALPPVSTTPSWSPDAPQINGRNGRSHLTADQQFSGARQDIHKSHLLGEELDFFGSAKSAPAKQISAPPDTNNRDTAGVFTATQAENTRVSEEECRRVLKEHKLRVTDLDVKIDESVKIQYSNSKRKLQAHTNESKKFKKRKLDVLPEPVLNFSDLQLRYGVDGLLARNLKGLGFEVPTEVQIGALPLLLGHWRHVSDSADDYDSHRPKKEDIDLLTVAPTGSGKTLAFLIPLIDHILKSGQKTGAAPRGIIIAPTKELANQILDEASKLVVDTGIVVGLGHKNLWRESNVGQDKISPDQGNSQNLMPDIIVSTPLTMVNAMKTEDEHSRTLPTVSRLVLDEADVLLDPLFREQTLRIWSSCVKRDLRVSLWSATMGASIEEVAKSTIVERRRRLATPEDESSTHAPLFRLIVGLKDSAIPHVQHRMLYCGNEAGKIMAMRQLLRPTGTSRHDEDPATLRTPFLVFTQTIPRAVALHSELLYDIPASAGGESRIAVLHADLPSAARADIIARMRRGQVWVLITTDLLSRGIDFKGINGVVNYDFPGSSAAYIHRVGRTGRAGRQGGVAVTLYAKEDVPFVKNVANVIAASQKILAQSASVPGSDTAQHSAGPSLAPWLLESLPNPTKRQRQKIKRRGIEERRPDAASRAQTRISTVGGWERRKLANRLGAIETNKQRLKSQKAQSTTARDADNDEFEGFD